MNKFWNFVEVSNKKAELLLHGPIASETWWGDEVTPKNFLKELNALGDKEEIVVRINSTGGDVFAAYTIASNLKDNPARIVGKIDGLCASAATIIACLCDYLMIPAYASYMIHNPSSFTWGDAKDMREMADLLDTIKEGIISAYRLKTDLSEDELSKMMNDTKWMNGEEAVELGFADEILFSKPVQQVDNAQGIYVVNSVNHDLSSFNNIPSELKALMEKREAKNNHQLSVDDKNKDDQGGNDLKIENVEQLRDAYPELVKQIENTANDNGVKAERNRIQNIEKVSKLFDPNLVNDAKFGDKPMSVNELLDKAEAQEAQVGQEQFQKVVKDSEESGAGDVTASGTDDKEKNAEAAARVSAMVAGGNARVEG